MNIVDIEKDKKKLQGFSGSNFALVTGVTPGKGVKIKIDGEDSALETFYNSLTVVNVNDRVFIQRVSGTILVIGKLQY